MKLINSYDIKQINYEEPTIYFGKLNRGLMPSMLTGKGPDDISGESIIGIYPVKNVEIYNMAEIWDTLQKLNSSLNFDEYEYPLNRLGAIGYISYEALHSIEKIKKKTINHFNMPLASWTLYSQYYFFDNINLIAWDIKINYFDLEVINGASFLDSGFNVKNLKPDYNMQEYKNNVNKIRDEIIKGEVYEVNLTQGILGDFEGSPYSLFNKLYKENNAPYSAYLERDNYSIICNSPELFLKVEGLNVETRPIKGTAPRSNNLIYDEKNRLELFNSSKNQAELYMIVDLMRNDLSKVCEIGSVKVINKKRIEKYKNVYHLVSIIRGKLKRCYNIIDLLKATFPGGSITGCPKVQCMKLTEEIEKSSRNLYTGTIYIMNKSFLNSNIVIRSAIIKDDKIVLNSGGAITIDSDPLEEYQESLIKLKSLFKAVNYEDYI